MEIAQRFFDPEKLVVTVVADRNKVESKLAQMGELHVYDTEGNLPLAWNRRESKPHPMRNKVRHNRDHTTIERLLFKLTFLENIL